MPCPGGTYTNLDGSAQCNNCLARLSSYKGSSSCDVCAEGYFRLDAQTVATPQSCDDSLCDGAGVHCPKDTTLETIVLLPGYWRLSNRSRVITACSGGNATLRCKGGRAGRAPEAPGSRLRRALRATVASDTPDGDGYCGALYIGPE